MHRIPSGTQKMVAAVNGRIVDLLNPFKSFNFYHPDQCGSASMKAVLPALTGKGYGELEIKEGETAGHGFVRVTFGDVAESRTPDIESPFSTVF